MITGQESITPQLKYRQEWEDRTDGDSLGLVNYTEGGITLKQHMVIEFSKALINSVNWNISPFSDGLVVSTVKNANLLANEVIKQLNDEDK